MVDNNHHLQVLVVAQAVGFSFLAGILVALRVHYELATLQELVAHVDGGIEIATTIVAQVDNHLLHALFLEFLDGLDHLVVGLGTKA